MCGPQTAESKYTGSMKEYAGRPPFLPAAAMNCVKWAKCGVSAYFQSGLCVSSVKLSSSQPPTKMFQDLPAPSRRSKIVVVSLTKAAPASAIVDVAG